MPAGFPRGVQGLVPDTAGVVEATKLPGQLLAQQAHSFRAPFAAYLVVEVPDDFAPPAQASYPLTIGFTLVAFIVTSTFGFAAEPELLEGSDLPTS